MDAIDTALFSPAVESSRTPPPLPKLPAIEPFDATGPSATLTLTPQSEPGVVYTRPVLPPGWKAPAITTRSWAVAAQDSLSALMARNLDQTRPGLAGQWKGLGEALLNRFKTTQADYTQTVVDIAVPEFGQKAVLPAQALAAVAQGRTTVSLHLQTRSGQTVTLTIAVGSASAAASNGIHVAVEVSGALSAAERDALVRLSDGFGQALEGLGQAGAVQLNMAGLLGYDSAIFSQVDLSVKQAATAATAAPSSPLGHFEWHAGAGGSSLSLQGRAGALSIAVDPGTAPMLADPLQQQAALRQYMAQFDAAAQRSHSDADLVAQFKRAFVQMHAAAEVQAQAMRSASAATSLLPLQMQVQPLLSGLHDFQASFDGGFSHAGKGGLISETGRSDFQASQKTTTQKSSDPAAAMTISQTQSTRLAADYLNSGNGGMLDTASGNYDRYRIRDHHEATTTIDIARKRLIGAVATSLQDDWLGYEKYVNHHVTDSRETPIRKVQSRNLL